MKHKARWFFIGFLSCALLLGSLQMVFSEQIERTLTAVYKDVKVFIDGQKIDPKNANGEPVEPFICDGTTYLPVRAIGEAFGKAVHWDPATASVYIGQRPDDITLGGSEMSTTVIIEMADGGVIKAELYPEIAPITVANFQKLVREGFYDGLTFHRIIEGFMIQGGDPLGNGTGGSADKIKGEFKKNGVDNPLSHTRGVLSMARSSDPNSAGSQFFIMHKDAPHLDGAYAAFGKVIEGLDVVDRIAEGTPVQDGNGTVAKADQPVIKKITLE